MTEKQRSLVRALLQEGKGLTEISQITGVPRSTVWSMRVKEAFPSTPALTLRDAEKELDRLSSIIENVESFMAGVRLEVRRCGVPVPKSPKLQKRSTKGVPVLVFSDWHVGEVNENESMEGFGKFNLSVAKRRIESVVEEFCTRFSGARKAVVFCLGDLITGHIHQSLVATNELSTPRQVAEAGKMLAEALLSLAASFREVEVWAVSSDNHSRIFKKPFSHGKSEWSLGLVVHEIAKAWTSKSPRIKWNDVAGSKGVAEVEGYRFLVEHGDSIKSYTESPLPAVLRLRGRESSKRLVSDSTFHYYCIGHFHVPVLHGTTIVNGCLSGTSEYDHMKGRYSPPCQVAFLVERKKGVTQFHVIEAS